MATYKSKVYAGKVDTYTNTVTDETVCLGEISFTNASEGFIKTIRLYNKNANRHLYDPQFMFKGHILICGRYGIKSKTGRGTTQYWELEMVKKGPKMPVTSYDFERKTAEIEYQHLMWIPKRKVNDKDALRYIEYPE